MSDFFCVVHVYTSKKEPPPGAVALGQVQAKRSTGKGLKFTDFICTCGMRLPIYSPSLSLRPVASILFSVELSQNPWLHRSERM